MYYIIYKTTNLINGKFYIGAHRGNTLDDSYLGSGHLLKYAIKKYGKSNFIRETLFVFDNSEDMFAKEAELVTEQFVNSQQTYNLKEGGIGLDSATAKQNRKSTNQKLLEKYGEDWHTIISEKGRSKGRIVLEELRKNPDFVNTQNKHREKACKAALSDEAKQKRKATMKANGHNKGEKSSSFGTMWINNPETNENRKIKKDFDIPDGWIKGRIIK